MSAIIAGKSCKACKKLYWLTFGHPKWYDNVVKRGMPESNAFRRFREIAKSGMCLSCYHVKEGGEEGEK